METLNLWKLAMVIMACKNDVGVHEPQEGMFG